MKIWSDFTKPMTRAAFFSFEPPDFDRSSSFLDGLDWRLDSPLGERSWSNYWMIVVCGAQDTDTNSTWSVFETHITRWDTAEEHKQWLPAANLHLQINCNRRFSETWLTETDVKLEIKSIEWVRRACCTSTSFPPLWFTSSVVLYLALSFCDGLDVRRCYPFDKTKQFHLVVMFFISETKQNTLCSNMASFQLPPPERL